MIRIEGTLKYLLKGPFSYLSYTYFSKRADKTLKAVQIFSSLSSKIFSVCSWKLSTTESLKKLPNYWKLKSFEQLKTSTYSNNWKLNKAFNNCNMFHEQYFELLKISRSFFQRKFQSSLLGLFSRIFNDFFSVWAKIFFSAKTFEAAVILCNVPRNALPRDRCDKFAQQCPSLCLTAGCLCYSYSPIVWWRRNNNTIGNRRSIYIWLHLVNLFGLDRVKHLIRSFGWHPSISIDHCKELKHSWLISLSGKRLKSVTTKQPVCSHQAVFKVDELFMKIKLWWLIKKRFSTVAEAIKGNDCFAKLMRLRLA